MFESCTSKIGRPVMLFTENRVPVNTSVTVNSLPWVPSTNNLSRLDIVVEPIATLPITDKLLPTAAPALTLKLVVLKGTI